MPRLLTGFFRPKYSAIIGVDPAGIVTASRLNTYNMPLVYISFELMFPEELEGRDAALHEQERLACATVALALVQDAERAAHLSRNSGIRCCRRLVL